MKTKLFTALMLFFTILLFAQTNFGLGFKKGYKEGYCYGQSVGCVSPPAPPTPVREPGESSDSFTDGYNKGFVLGRGTADNKMSTNNSMDRQRYHAQSVDHVERPIYQPSSNVNETLYALKEQILNEFSAGNLQHALDMANTGLKFAPRDKDFIDLKKFLTEKIQNNTKDIANETNNSISVLDTKSDEYNQRTKYDNPKQEIPANNFYSSLRNFSGIEEVYTYAPITDKPSMGDGERQIGAAENNKVTVLSKENNKYYKVQSGLTVGYLWAGWFK